MLYNQIVGQAYSIVTPLAGLGGEPFKVTHLSKYLSTEEVLIGSIKDRLLHSASGITYSALTLTLVLIYQPIDNTLKSGMIYLNIALWIVSILFISVILSKKMQKGVSSILKKFNLDPNKINYTSFKKSIFLQAFSLKLLGRILMMLEFWLILHFLNVQFYFFDLITISCMLSISSTLAFFVPQGIGVHEAGITGAFKIIGKSVEFGLSVGIIRRSGVLFWGLFGLALHLTVVMLNRFSKKKHNF